MTTPRLSAMTADDVGAAADVCLRTTLVAYRALFPLDAPPPTPAQLAADWRRRLEGGAAGIMAADGREVVGVVSASERDDEPGVGLLARLYVVPERWGDGIGRSLYDAAIDEFRRRSLPTASLWVLRPNLRARSWYERLGWSPSGATKTVYAPAGIEDVEYRTAVR